MVAVVYLCTLTTGTLTHLKGWGVAIYRHSPEGLGGSYLYRHSPEGLGGDVAHGGAHEELDEAHDGVVASSTYLHRNDTLTHLKGWGVAIYRHSPDGLGGSYLYRHSPEGLGGDVAHGGTHEELDEAHDGVVAVPVYTDTHLKCWELW